MSYLELIKTSFIDYYNYMVESILHPDFSKNYTLYFYFLIILSMIVWFIEISIPWRKKQAIFRKGFWQDAFYMFFNFFIFSLIGYNAISNVGVQLYTDAYSYFGLSNVIFIHLESLPGWFRFLLLFLLYDFVQWLVHVTLHKIPWMWEFHKVHHSVTEMGRAAHLRFHWVESFIYKTTLFVILSFFGFGIEDLFFMHIFSIIIGHLNHANIKLEYGPLKYIFNNPKMHIWHHAKEMPASHPDGINFGITLSIWDYLFKKAYIPKSGRDVELGFDGIEKYPSTILGQMIEPFRKG